MARDREAEKSYSRREVIGKLRRMADALEAGRRCRIQIAGERVSIPPDATIEIEHTRTGDEEEVEVELKWKRD